MLDLTCRRAGIEDGMEIQQYATEPGTRNRAINRPRADRVRGGQDRSADRGDRRHHAGAGAPRAGCRCALGRRHR